MRLICAKSSHTGWINDIMKEGKWVAASWLLMNIGATWLSSATSTMHHNLHQLFGSSWPAPSGWRNLTWHPAIKHHHGDGKLKTFFLPLMLKRTVKLWKEAEELPSPLSHALSLSSSWFPSLFPRKRTSPSYFAGHDKESAPLQFYTSGRAAPAVPPPPKAVLSESLWEWAVRMAQHLIISRSVMPHGHACVHGDNTQRVSLGKVLRPEERMFLRPRAHEEKQWLTSFLIINVSWLALKG